MLFERVSFYGLNGFITRYEGAIEMHLIDLSLVICEVEQNPTHINSISMIMLVHFETNLRELSTHV